MRFLDEYCVVDKFHHFSEMPHAWLPMTVAGLGEAVAADHLRFLSDNGVSLVSGEV